MVSTDLKNMIVKLDHFPKDQGENFKKHLSCHHQVILFKLHTHTHKHTPNQIVNGSIHKSTFYALPKETTMLPETPETQPQPPKIDPYHK